MANQRGGKRLTSKAMPAVQDVSPVGRTIEIDSERSLYFVQEGAGPPLLLIHGALATHADWRPDLRSDIARLYRVITLDRPGHGRSRRPRFLGSPRAQARQIRDALKLREPAVLAAHSLGGAVALAYAELYPAEVAALLLISPICLPEFRPIEHLYLAPRAVPFLGPFASWGASLTSDPAFFEIAATLMFAPRPISRSWRERIEADRILSAEMMVAEGEDAAAMAPTSPGAYLRLGNLASPVHILLGDNDIIVRHERHGLPLALMTKASMRRASGIGHMLHEDASDLVLESIRKLDGGRR